MIEVRNGWHWKAPDPILHEMISQWLHDDVWVFMTAPYTADHGGTAQMPGSDPDVPGKITYTKDELAARIEKYRYTRIEGRTLVAHDHG